MAVVQLRWRWLFFILFVLSKSSVKAFVLEGSPNSYAQFKRWYAGVTDSLSFDFRTTEPNGLLLYLDDGGISDFIELKLVDGTLRLRFNLGGGALLIHAGRNLHDDQWHHVELIRNVEDTLLRVDDDTQSKVTKGNDYLFGNFSGNSFVYIGGIPSWYSAKLTQMSLPSVFFEPHFRGSIRNVVYASEEGSHQHQDMIEFKGIRSNDLDACKHHDPCQHGGECISTDSGAICNCNTGDYDGNFCEK
ncbi:Neurexin-2-alpha, partial [Stegodyphus mimosarum]